MRCRRLRFFALVLIFSLLSPSLSTAAPKPPDLNAIREKIIKRGVGAWICVEEKNGLLLAGRVTGMDEDSFGLQLHNYPEVTVVYYSDVTRLRNIGLSGKGAAILIGTFAAASVALALIAHHEMKNMQKGFPPAP